jgi:hypothetical protein
MWNSRVTLTVLASVLALALMCSLAGAAYRPYYAQRWDERLTQHAVATGAEVASATAEVVATRVAHRPTETAIAGATQTEVARPTETPTPTDTPTPTATPTTTLPPSVAECPASVRETGLLLYPVPGGGQVREAISVPRASVVTIIGRLEDNGWLQVRSAQGQTGWMRSDGLAPNPPTCQANIYDLSYLLGLTEHGTLVADDTLISNENGWANEAGEPLSPVLTDYGEAQILVQSNGWDRLHPTSNRLADVPAFELITSFARVNFFSDSYVGVRFRNGGLTYYEVRVQRNCRVGIYAVNELVFARPVDPGPNTCTDAQEDFLHLTFTPENRLTVQLNDGDPFEVTLEDEAGLYAGGGLDLVVSEARVNFSYVVVTKPK